MTMKTLVEPSLLKTAAQKNAVLIIYQVWAKNLPNDCDGSNLCKEALATMYPKMEEKEIRVTLHAAAYVVFFYNNQIHNLCFQDKGVPDLKEMDKLISNPLSDFARDIMSECME